MNSRQRIIALSMLGIAAIGAIAFAAARTWRAPSDPTEWNVIGEIPVPSLDLPCAWASRSSYRDNGDGTFEQVSSNALAMTEADIATLLTLLQPTTLSTIPDCVVSLVWTKSSGSAWYRNLSAVSDDGSGDRCSLVEEQAPNESGTRTAYCGHLMWNDTNGELQLAESGTNARAAATGLVSVNDDGLTRIEALGANGRILIAANGNGDVAFIPATGGSN